MTQNVFNSSISALEIDNLYSLVEFIRFGILVFGISKNIQHTRNLFFWDRTKALTRWLFPEEIYLMLSLLQVQNMWHDIGRDSCITVALSSIPPRQPRSTVDTLLIYFHVHICQMLYA